MSGWKSRWSWVRFVKPAAAKRTPVTRSSSSACDETSIAHARSPASTIRRSVACRSTLSGVVRATGSTTPPTRDSTVPSSPACPSAASSTACTRKTVVVLPFVPVTPTTASSALGWP